MGPCRSRSSPSCTTSSARSPRPPRCGRARTGRWCRASDGAAGVVGLLHGDVRLLCGIEVAVDDDPGVPVAHRRGEDGGVVFTSLLRGLDAAHADTSDPRVRLDRLRSVVPGRLVEELTLSSTLDVAVDVRVTVRLTPDATPMELVRVGGRRVAVCARARRRRVDGGRDRRDRVRPGRDLDRGGRPADPDLGRDAAGAVARRRGLDGGRRRPRARRRGPAVGPGRRRGAAAGRARPAPRTVAGTFRGGPRRTHARAARPPGRRLLRRGRALVLHPLRPRQPVGGRG